MYPTVDGPATELDHLYLTLRPEPLIRPEEFRSYYRPQVNEVRGEDTVAPLSLKLQQAYRTLPFKAFVMGHPGVGKSTEMSRLLERVKDQQVGVRLNVATELNPACFQVFDVLLLMLIRLAESADRIRAVPLSLMGAEHPDTAVSMNNLTATLRTLGDLDGARRLQDRVLEVRTRVLGGEHPDTLTSMNNLASTLRAQGDHAGARRLQERVLAVRTPVLGEEHPDTLTAMNNLAGTLGSQGDLDGARRLQERVLEASMRVLGEEHPRTLAAMNNLAATLSAQGNLDRARQLQEQVLAVKIRVQSEHHPDTLRAMNNLAAVMLEDAMRVLRQSLAGHRKVLGENHPDTVATAELLRQVEAQANQPAPTASPPPFHTPH
jgi:tetratricopeptide (TPR) repeat protein